MVELWSYKTIRIIRVASLFEVLRKGRVAEVKVAVSDAEVIACA